MNETTGTINTQWVLASNNPGKLAELSDALEDFNIVLSPQGLLNIEDALEDRLSFVENAIIKARHASTLSGLPALADDSGLEVAALGGRPGIYSARFSGEHATDQDNNRKLLAELADKSDRSARFVCVLAFIRHAHDPTPQIFYGDWSGHIGRQPEGCGGFGYDPLFLPCGESGTSAQLPPARKRALSHRGQAIIQLRRWLQG